MGSGLLCSQTLRSVPNRTGTVVNEGIVCFLTDADDLICRLALAGEKHHLLGYFLLELLVKVLFEDRVLVGHTRNCSFPDSKTFTKVSLLVEVLSAKGLTKWLVVYNYRLLACEINDGVFEALLLAERNSSWKSNLQTYFCIVCHV